MSNLVSNRKAFHEYEVLEKHEAGISLTGTEVKSCRQNGASLQESYVRPRGGELFLINAHIAAYDKGGYNNHDPRRDRRLLMHRREIRKLRQMTDQKGLTLVPLRLYLAHGLIKVEVGVCRGKKLHDKRETLRRKQQDIESKRAVQAASR